LLELALAHIKYDSIIIHMSELGVLSSNVERLTVTLTTEMARTVRGVVESGAYASSSEVIREALREWQHKRDSKASRLDQLRAAVQAGLDDIDAGRVHDFDVDDIIALEKQRLADRSASD
jgi:antitoxin ParD1/3/4